MNQIVDDKKELEKNIEKLLKEFLKKYNLNANNLELKFTKGTLYDVFVNIQIII